MNLYDLEVGKIALVKRINSCDNERRLLDIGLIENTKVTSLYKSPFGKIKAYLIRGSVIAIRQNDACKIEVELI